MAAFRQLSELVNEQESALPFVTELCGRIPGRCEISPANSNAGDALVALQVTTRSPLGAVVFHTGGIVVDCGWLRILGSGKQSKFRSLPDWNSGRSDGFLLVADDAAGGFFAIDGGALGFEPGHVCYWAPDSLEWMSLEAGYSAFLTWAFSGDLTRFYSDLRWGGWQAEVEPLSLDDCIGFFPFLWTTGSGIEQRCRAKVPVREAFDLKVDIVRQLSAKPNDA